ncbi:hypothetical protein A4G29_01125 [Mycobacterium kansasii]|nr:hypothetical protein A4G29_01125 [Mycobacterium kansasii]
MPEPGGNGRAQLEIGEARHPGDMPVGPDQHCGWGCDRAKHRKFRCANVFRVNQLDAIGPWCDVEVARLG